MQIITAIIKLLSVRVKLSCSSTLESKEREKKPLSQPPNSLMASLSFHFPQCRLRAAQQYNVLLI